MANHFVEDMVNPNCQTLLAGMRNVFAFLRKFLLVSQKHFRGIHEILYELITYLHAQLATQAGQLYIEDNRMVRYFGTDFQKRFSNNSQNLSNATTNRVEYGNLNITSCKRADKGRRH